VDADKYYTFLHDYFSWDVQQPLADCSVLKLNFNGLNSDTFAAGACIYPVRGKQYVVASNEG